MDQNPNPELDALFTSYRNAVVVPDASPDFMPGLWRRIDQRRTVTYSFRRLASGFVTAAAALCLAMTLAMWAPSQIWSSSQLSAGTYVEILADNADNPLADQADAE
jgi:hypothetical protein